MSLAKVLTALLVTAGVGLDASVKVDPLAIEELKKEASSRGMQTTPEDVEALQAAYVVMFDHVMSNIPEQCQKEMEAGAMTGPSVNLLETDGPLAPPLSDECQGPVNMAIDSFKDAWAGKLQAEASGEESAATSRQASSGRQLPAGKGHSKGQAKGQGSTKGRATGSKSKRR